MSSTSPNCSGGIFTFSKLSNLFLESVESIHLSDFDGESVSMLQPMIQQCIDKLGVSQNVSLEVTNTQLLTSLQDITPSAKVYCICRMRLSSRLSNFTFYLNTKFRPYLQRKKLMKSNCLRTVDNGYF